MRGARTMLGVSVVISAAWCVGEGRATAGEPVSPRLSFLEPPPAAEPAAGPRTLLSPDTQGQPGARSGPDHNLAEQGAPGLTVQIEPMLWFVGPSGKFKLPVTSGTGPGSFTSDGDKIKVNDLNLEATRLSPAGNLAVASGKWRFAFSGSEYSLSRSDEVAERSGRLGAVAFATGDRLKFDFSFETYELTAGYRIWDRDFKERTQRPESAIDAVVALRLFGGVRLYDVSIAAESITSGARAEGSHLFFEPIVGVWAETIIDSDFSVIVQLSAGGLPLYSTSSFSLDVALAFQWRPTANIGVQIGWRQIAFDLQDGRDLDKFQYTGRLAGLFTGVVIRF